MSRRSSLWAAVLALLMLGIATVQHDRRAALIAGDSAP